jgi:hypothetical protein
MRRKNALTPYTSWKGESSKELFTVTLSAHRENLSFESHAFLLSSNIFLMIFNAFVRGFFNPISLRIVRGGMNQSDPKLFT